MLWRILPHATACIASGKLILLDLRQDRYFQVPPKWKEPLLGWLNLRHSAPPPAEVRAMLMRMNILRAFDEEPTNVLRERVGVPDAPSPQSGIRAERASPLLVGHKVAATWLKLKVRALHHIIQARAARAPLPVPGDPGEIIAHAGAFERARALSPIARDCLLDSLALDAWLARRGLGSQLVFGVTVEPFRAHCWLQTPRAILNDSFDNVSGFTPILVQ